MNKTHELSSSAQCVSEWVYFCITLQYSIPVPLYLCISLIFQYIWTYLPVFRIQVHLYLPIQIRTIITDVEDSVTDEAVTVDVVLI